MVCGVWKPHFASPAAIAMPGASNATVAAFARSRIIVAVRDSGALLTELRRSLVIRRRDRLMEREHDDRRRSMAAEEARDHARGRRDVLLAVDLVRHDA